VTPSLQITVNEHVLQVCEEKVGGQWTTLKENNLKLTRKVAFQKSWSQN
jgi:hypothetical protein